MDKQPNQEEGKWTLLRLNKGWQCSQVLQLGLHVYHRGSCATRVSHGASVCSYVSTTAVSDLRTNI